MKVQKTIRIPGWNDKVRNAILEFWEARDFRFTNTIGDILEGYRGTAWIYGGAKTTDIRVSLVVAPVGPQEIAAAIEPRPGMHEISLWDKAFWFLELDSFESWLLQGDRREAEWREFLSDRQGRIRAGADFIPGPVTFHRLRLASGHDDEPIPEPPVRVWVCPQDVANPVMEIIQQGILIIRASGWNRNPGRCAIEADHLHNLPDLLQYYAFRKLEYYLTTERSRYLAALKDEPATHFPEAYAAPWAQLDEYHARTKSNRT